jgi:hypothetical protein
MMRRLASALALVIAARVAPGQAAGWDSRVSIERPFWTAAVGAGRLAQYFTGYGAELGTERELRPGQTIGASVVLMRRLNDGPLACETGDQSAADDCGYPLGNSSGFFAEFRQYVPRTRSGARLAATLGLGLYEFDGYDRGNRVEAYGPALLYGGEFASPTLWDLSLVLNVRAHLVVDPTASPLHVTTMSVGLRAR